MTNIPAPLDVQIAEERARHPTARQAARAGMGFGLVVGAVTAAVQIGMTFMPATLPVHPPAQRAWLEMLVAPLLGSVVTAVVLFEVGAALVRWRRRAGVQAWYRDPAA